MSKKAAVTETPAAEEPENDLDTADTDADEIIEAPATETKAPGGGDPFFEITEVDGKWYWMFWSGNGRPWATCVRSFSKKIHAINNIRDTQREMTDLKIGILQATR